MTRRSCFYDSDFYTHRYRPFIYWDTKPLKQYNVNTCIRYLYLHPLMHIITYKNGMSKNGNLKSKTGIRLQHSFICQISYMFLAIVNVTYVTQCYKVKYCGKVLEKHVTHRQNGTIYFLIMVVRVS